METVLTTAPLGPTANQLLVELDLVGAGCGDARASLAATW
jgi:hypothetical protein